MFCSSWYLPAAQSGTRRGGARKFFTHSAELTLDVINSSFVLNLPVGHASHASVVFLNCSPALHVLHVTDAASFFGVGIYQRRMLSMPWFCYQIQFQQRKTCNSPKLGYFAPGICPPHNPSTPVLCSQIQFQLHSFCTKTDPVTLDMFQQRSFRTKTGPVSFGMFQLHSFCTKTGCFHLDRYPHRMLHMTFDGHPTLKCNPLDMLYRRNPSYQSSHSICTYLLHTSHTSHIQYRSMLYILLLHTYCHHTDYNHCTGLLYY